MTSNSTQVTKISTKELAQLALICAAMFAGKEIMASIPNVHPVMLLIIVAGNVYGWKAMLPVAGFSLLEILVYGLGLWNIMYLYIWPLALVLVMIFRGSRSRIFWATVAGIYGFAFGALCCLPTLLTGGFKAAFGYWVAGIPFDLIHGLSNIVITYLLFQPLHEFLLSLKEG